MELLLREIHAAEEERATGGRHGLPMAAGGLGKAPVPWRERGVCEDEGGGRAERMALEGQRRFVEGGEMKAMENYPMVKIPRPKQLTFDDVRRR